MASKFVRLGRPIAINKVVSPFFFSRVQTARVLPSHSLVRTFQSVSQSNSAVVNFTFVSTLARPLPKLHLQFIRNISTDPNGGKKISVFDEAIDFSSTNSNVAENVEKKISDVDFSSTYPNVADNVEKKISAFDLDEAIDLSSTLDKHWFTAILDTFGDTFQVVRETFGLGWVPFIFILSASIRLSFFPFTLKTLRSNEANSTKTEDMSRKMREAMGRKDLAEAQRLRAELLQGSFSFGKMAPFAAQALLMTGVFLTLRNLALTGAHHFSNGGIFWFKDLTSSDPTMLLPLCSAVTTYLLMRTGPSYEKMASSIGLTIMIYALPVVITIFTFQLPASCLVYIIAGNTFTIVQNLILKVPAVKDYFGLSKTSNLAPVPANASRMKPQTKKKKD